MTPPLVPKKRVLSDNPKKKRVRKKDEVQTILTKEKKRLLFLFLVNLLHDLQKWLVKDWEGVVIG